MSVTSWKKIESAPKDGTHIVAYDAALDGLVIIRWRGGDFPGEWVVSWDGAPNPDCTYWLPIPPIPID